MIPRLTSPKVRKALSRQAAVALPGPRQVGKTTLAHAIDEILTETYAEREAYAAEHGNSVQRIFEDLKRKEAAVRRLLPQPPE
jgi:predicted AAA+ superfamily ATPase